MLPFLDQNATKPTIIEERDAEGNRTELRSAEPDDHVQLAETLMGAFKAKDMQAVAAILKEILGA
jgi:hypothetical protein